jgi:hypothetical protein
MPVREDHGHYGRDIVDFSVTWDDIVGKPDNLGGPPAPITLDVPDFADVLDWSFRKVRLWDTDKDYRLDLIWDEDDDADRELKLRVNGSSPILQVENDSYIDQDVTKDATPEFEGLYIDKDKILTEMLINNATISGVVDLTFQATTGDASIYAGDNVILWANQDDNGDVIQFVANLGGLVNMDMSSTALTLYNIDLDMNGNTISNAILGSIGMAGDIDMNGYSITELGDLTFNGAANITSPSGMSHIIGATTMLGIDSSEVTINGGGSTNVVHGAVSTFSKNVIVNGALGINTAPGASAFYATTAQTGFAFRADNTASGAGSHSGMIISAGEDSGDSILLLRKYDGTEKFEVRGDGLVLVSAGGLALDRFYPLYFNKDDGFDNYFAGVGDDVEFYRQGTLWMDFNANGLQMKNGAGIVLDSGNIDLTGGELNNVSVIDNGASPVEFDSDIDIENSGVTALTLRNTETGAIENPLGEICFSGKNGVGSQETFAKIAGWTAGDIGSGTEEGQINFYAFDAGVFSLMYEMDAGTAKVYNQNGVAGQWYQNNETGATSNQLGDLVMRGKNASGSVVSFAEIIGSTGTNITAGSETGSMDLKVAQAGALTTKLSIQATELRVFDQLTMQTEPIAGVTDIFLDTINERVAGANISFGDPVHFGAVLEDKISLFDDRLGLSTGYCMGMETSTFYFKSGAQYRWYIGTNADGGSSDYMELTTTKLTVNVDQDLAGNELNNCASIDNGVSDISIESDIDLNANELRFETSDFFMQYDTSRVRFNLGDGTEVFNFDTSGITILDDNTLEFGTGGDVEMYYDATDLIINTDKVGTGSCKINSLEIDKDGFIKPITSADGSAPNNSIYYSSTASKLVYKDGSGTVNNLY